MCKLSKPNGVPLSRIFGHTDRAPDESLQEDEKEYWDFINRRFFMINVVQSSTPNMSIVFRGGENPLIQIHPDGTVEADSIETACEAGKVFVESIRENLNSLFNVEKITELHKEIEDLKLRLQMSEKDNRET